jgi:hypothetical protein
MPSAGRCGRAARRRIGLGIDGGCWLGVVRLAREARHVTGLLTIRVAGPRPWHENLRKPDSGRHRLPVRTRRRRRQQRRLDGFRRQRIGQRHRPTGRTGRRTAPVAVSGGRTPRVGFNPRCGMRWTFRLRLRPSRWFRAGVRIGLRSQRSETVRVGWMPVTPTAYVPAGTLRWVAFATRGRIPVMGITCRRLAVPVGRCAPGYATRARPCHAQGIAVGPRRIIRPGPWTVEIVRDRARAGRVVPRPVTRARLYDAGLSHFVHRALLGCPR